MPVSERPSLLPNIDASLAGLSEAGSVLVLALASVLTALAGSDRLRLTHLTSIPDVDCDG